MRGSGLVVQAPGSGLLGLGLRVPGSLVVQAPGSGLRAEA